MNADNLSIIDWLQMDQQFLYESQTAMNNYRSGQAARRVADERRAQQRAG